jgi:organic hydroperoxide reductase OsmC/OhrA
LAVFTVHLHNVDGTGATLGFAGTHTVVVDRPDGRAGGKGLGFNGAELLALAVGGCFSNDLQYAAHEMGVVLGKVAIEVAIDIEGTPMLATNVRMNVVCETASGEPATQVIEKAKTVTMASNSLRRGVPVEIVG